MSKAQYKCLVKDCGKICDSPRGIKTHLRRIHNIRKPKETKHYQYTDKSSAENTRHWKRWQKYPDGSRKYRLIDGQWVKQQPGDYFRDNRKKKSDHKSSPAIGTQFGQPMIDNGYILLPITLRIPFALGIPQIFQDAQDQED